MKTLAEGRSQIFREMPEAELQERVIELACLFGWLVHAERPARSQKGWRTPIQGDPGFPDLVLARNGVVWFVELKRADGRAGAGQNEWLHETKGIVWRPQDLESGAIEIALRSPEATRQS